jgi:hypothetical protein
MSTAIACLLGALIFGGGWWLLGKQLANDHRIPSPILSEDQKTKPNPTETSLPTSITQTATDSNCSNIVSDENSTLNCPSSQGRKQDVKKTSVPAGNKP